MKDKIGIKKIIFISILLIIFLFILIGFYEYFVTKCGKGRFIYVNVGEQCPGGYTRGAVPAHDRCYSNTKKCPPSIVESIRCGLFVCPRVV